MFLLFHSSFLLGQLFQFVLLGELIHHVPSEFLLHAFLFLFLQSLSFLGVTLSLDHLVLLSLPLFSLLLFLSSHLRLILFLVKLPSQAIQFLSISSSLLFLPLELLENLILCFFFLLPNLLNCFLSGIQFLDVSQVLGLFLPDELQFSQSLLFLDF